MNESDLTPILVHDFAIGFKTENTRPKKAIEFMFRNKPGHIAGNKCKQKPDAIVPFMKERAN